MRMAPIVSWAVPLILGAALCLASCGDSGDEQGSVSVTTLAPAPLPAPAPAPASPSATSPAPAGPGPAAGAPAAGEFVPANTVRTDVGSGDDAAAIFRRRGLDAPGPVVVFLHGWAAVDPSRYGPWIGHLARRGDTVIYPAYQTRPYVHTARLLSNVVAAVRLALARFPAPAGRLVFAGHSAGAALAIDLAATAALAGLPSPAAVLSAYPGRRIHDVPHSIPAANAAEIPATTRMLVLFGQRDRAVGSSAARAAAAAAVHAQVTLAMVTDDRVDEHSAPREDGAASRATFWVALDDLVDETRG